LFENLSDYQLFKEYLLHGVSDDISMKIKLDDFRLVESLIYSQSRAISEYIMLNYSLRLSTTP